MPESSFDDKLGDGNLKQSAKESQIEKKAADYDLVRLNTITEHRSNTNQISSKNYIKKI